MAENNDVHYEFVVRVYRVLNNDIHIIAALVVLIHFMLMTLSFSIHGPNVCPENDSPVADLW